jgi:hypothetical protein
MDKSEKLKGRCSWSSSIFFMLEPGLGYRTISFTPIPLHLPSVLSHISMQHKVHPSQSGSTKMVVTASNVGQFRSDTFTFFLVKSANDLGLPPPSYTASSVMRTRLTTTKMTAPCGKFVAGALPLTMCIMTVLPLITDVS